MQYNDLYHPDGSNSSLVMALGASDLPSSKATIHAGHHHDSPARTSTALTVQTDGLISRVQ